VSAEVRVEGCQGHGLCYLSAPDFFVPDEDGYATVPNPEPSPGALPAVRDAVAGCPERAIVFADA
jgi:ferredoxin